MLGPMGRARHARSPRRRTLAAARPVLLACALAALAAAPAANAGQIVWGAHNAIWSMGDDGSSPHRLISGRDPRLAGILPQGTVASPDVFANGGTTVLFLGDTRAFAPIGAPAACGQGCTDTLALRRARSSTSVRPPVRSRRSAYYESQPRLTADGQELFSWSLWSGLGGRRRGDRAHRAGGAADPEPAGPRAWRGRTRAAASMPPSGFDGAPDPADPTQAAWVELQGCGNYTLNGMPACQFAVRIGARATAAAPVSIYDDEYQGSATSGGAGPTSLDWSADGSELLMVDPFAPNDGIYEFAAATVATPGKPVTEVLAQPAGWSFNQARFAGEHDRVRCPPGHRRHADRRHLHDPGELHGGDLQLPGECDQPHQRPVRRRLGPRLDRGDHAVRRVRWQRARQARPVLRARRRHAAAVADPSPATRSASGSRSNAAATIVLTSRRGMRAAAEADRLGRLPRRRGRQPAPRQRIAAGAWPPAPTRRRSGRRARPRGR